MRSGRPGPHKLIVATGSIPAIGNDLVKCQHAALSIDSGFAALRMSYGLCILLEMITERNSSKKAAFPLPSTVSPKSDMLLSINRER